MKDGERFESASELPNGDLLVSVTSGSGPDLLPDLCTSTIYEVNPASSKRRLFNVGGHPVVSPDGQRVVFANRGNAFRYWDGVSCDVSRLTIRTLGGGPDVVLNELQMSDGPEREPVRARGISWAPDSARFIVKVGAYTGGIAESVYYPGSSELVVPKISAALDTALRATAPAQVESSWKVFLGPWLSDNTLVVSAYDYGAGPANYQPRRYVLNDGDVVDIGDEITDGALLDAIDEWERNL